MLLRLSLSYLLDTGTITFSFSSSSSCIYRLFIGARDLLSLSGQKVSPKLKSHRTWTEVGLPLCTSLIFSKVKRMQRSGTEAIRSQNNPSNPKREITKIANSQNTKQLFPKRWPLSNPNRTKNNMNTRKVKRHRNTDTKNRQQRTTTKLPPLNGQ